MVVAVARVKDEADVIEATVRRMLRQVDHVIVADNASTDGTRDILERLPVELIDDPEVGYYQSAAMTGLALRAAAQGAEWVVPFDADEVWLPMHRGRIADVLGRLDDCVLVVEAPLFDHVPTATDPAHGDPVARIGWRRPAMCPLRKVAARARPGLTIQQGNHAATFTGTGIRYPPTVTNALQVRHYPYRTVEQFVSKARNGAAAYAATDLPEEMGGHWRQFGRVLAEHGEEGLADLFHRDFHQADTAGLVHDPA